MPHTVRRPRAILTATAVALALVAGWAVGTFVPLPIRLPTRAHRGPPVLTFPAVARVRYHVSASDGISTTLIAPDAPAARVPAVWLPEASHDDLVMETDVAVEPDGTTIRATFRAASGRTDDARTGAP